jgi:hypothetical protein
MLFCFLLSLGTMIAGLTAYVMSWPLVTTQLRDRQPQLLPAVQGGIFAPASFGWLLRGGFRVANDQALNFLALPARIGAFAIVLGGIAALAFGAVVVLNK